MFGGERSGGGFHFGGGNPDQAVMKVFMANDQVAMKVSGASAPVVN